MGPYLADGETMPDVALLLTLAVRRVASLLEHLATAVRRDDVAGVAFSEARRDRWAAWHEVTAVLSHLRNIFEGLFGHRPQVTQRLCASPPKQPDDLLRHAELALAALRQPEPGLPELTGVYVDRELLASDLEPGAVALRLALDKMLAGEGRVHRTKRAKKQAQAAYQAAFGPARRLLEALTALAGKKSLRPAETVFKRELCLDTLPPTDTEEASESSA